jgi:hypothetical protein
MPFDEALPMNLKQEITVTGTNFASKFFDWMLGPTDEPLQIAPLPSRPAPQSIGFP